MFIFNKLCEKTPVPLTRSVRNSDTISGNGRAPERAESSIEWEPAEAAKAQKKKAVPKWRFVALLARRRNTKNTPRILMNKLISQKLQ
jgi:hypothetical protein